MWVRPPLAPHSGDHTGNRAGVAVLLINVMAGGMEEDRTLLAGKNNCWTIKRVFLVH